MYKFNMNSQKDFMAENIQKIDFMQKLQASQSCTQNHFKKSQKLENWYKMLHS